MAGFASAGSVILQYSRVVTLSSQDIPWTIRRDTLKRSRIFLAMQLLEY